MPVLGNLRAVAVFIPQIVKPVSWRLCIINHTGIDVKPEKREAGQGRQVRDFSDFTEEQLAALLVGYGSGIPFAGFLDTAFPETICDKEGKPLTCNDHPAGHNGYVSPAIKDKGIHSVFYMDGPAG